MPQLTDASLYRYTLPLTKPLRLGPVRLTEREGLLLQLRTAGGAVGWGEIAPLPAFSPGSLADAEAQARRLCTWLTDRDVPADALTPEGSFPAAVDALELLPSVRCGLEGALAWLLAAHAGQPLASVLGSARRTTVTLNGLLTASDDLAAEAQRLKQAGYPVVKMKVGRHTVATDVVRVRQAREALGAEVALRLDANRAWSWPEALTFAEALGALDTLDYIEEPLADPSQLPRFAEATGWPVALDETLVGLAPEAVAEHTYAAALVCKPMLLGGPVPVRRLAAVAADWGGRTVLSAAFETGVGMRVLLALAAALDTPEASGLDTYRRLAEDTLQPRLPFDGAEVSLASGAFQQPTVVTENLTRLSL